MIEEIFEWLGGEAKERNGGRKKEVRERRGLAGSGDLGDGSLKKARTGRESIYGTNLMSSTFYYSPILLGFFLSSSPKH